MKKMKILYFISSICVRTSFWVWGIVLPFGLLAQNKQDFNQSLRSLFADYPYIPIRDYKPGMRFVVSPINWDKEDQTMKNFYVATDYDPNSGKPKEKRSQLSHNQLSGKAIKLIDIVERKPGGKNKTYFVFQVQGLDFLVEYELDFQVSNPKPPKQTAIEYLCYYDEIEALEKDLVGRQVYLRSNTIHYFDPKTKNRKSAMYAQRFLTARIEKVLPWFGGTTKIGYTTEEGDYGEVEIIISGTNLFDKPKNAHRYSFDHYFLLESPRFLFDEQTWKKIAKSELWRGMSPLEARLSQGEPDAIRQHHQNQTWKYPNRVLIFSGEKLKEWKP
jgi:hypothetical protein